MTECVTCMKFNTCEKSGKGYRDIRAMYPRDLLEHRLKRIDMLRERFKDCDEYV